MVVQLCIGVADGVDEVAEDVFLEGEGHVVLQLAGQCAVAAAGDNNSVGQAAGEYGVLFNDGFSTADDIAYSGVGEVVGDVVVESGLGLGLSVLQNNGIKAGDPAFGFVDGAAVGEVGGQLFGVEAADLDGIKTLEIIILFITGVHCYPGICITVFGAS